METAEVVARVARPRLQQMLQRCVERVAACRTGSSRR